MAEMIVDEDDIDWSANGTDTEFYDDFEKPLNTYTQRQWDRVVGIGKVPDKYKIDRK
jgi:hypothetical protein